MINKFLLLPYLCGSSISFESTLGGMPNSAEISFLSLISMVRHYPELE